jgi:hypothetical protein
MRRWVRFELGSWRPAMNTFFGARPSSAAFVGPTLNPPSSATSCTLIPSRMSSSTVCGSSVSSAGVADLCRHWEDQPTGAALGVLVHFRQLRDESEFVGLPQLPLADRPGVRIEQRHDPVLDRLPRHTLLDLSTSVLASPERRRTVRVIVRSL